MFTVIKSEYGQLLGDCKVRGAYETLEEAKEALTNELWFDAKASGCDDVEVTTWLDDNGMPCGEHDASEAQWRVFEVRSHRPKLNPNVAETVSYECAGDPRFSSGGVLLHKAVVTWNSGKTCEVHAPERVELRIGGTSYEYKAV